MLVTAICQHKTYLQDRNYRIPEDAYTAGLEHRGQWKIYGVVEPSSNKTPQSVSMSDLTIRLIKTTGFNFNRLQGGHRKRSRRAYLADESYVSVQLLGLISLLLVQGT